ncbi:molybdate ABC transporter substrate-binding protein [Luteococcus sediminum]
MTTRRTLLATLALLPVAACGTTPSAPVQDGSSSPSTAPELTVFAPGALAAHTQALTAAYTAEGLGTVVFEVGHTPVQREQLAKGAAPDVWISASPTDMAAAAQENLVAAQENLVAAKAVTPVATTRLVVLTAPGNPARIDSVEDLAGKDVTVLLAAETLPIWKTTAKTFARIDAAHPGFSQKVLANTVSREMGVQAIVSKVRMGEADAGIVFVTDVPKYSTDIDTVEIPENLNTSLALSAAP